MLKEFDELLRRDAVEHRRLSGHPAERGAAAENQGVMAGRIRFSPPSTAAVR